MSTLYFGPIIGRDGVIATSTETDDLVPGFHVRHIGHVYGRIIHGNPPENLTAPSAYENETPVGNRQRKTVGITGRNGRYLMRRVKTPCPPVSERSPGRQFAHLGNARFKRQHGLELKSLATVRVEASVKVNSRADDIERLPGGLREIVDGIARGDMDFTKSDPLRLKRGK